MTKSALAAAADIPVVPGGQNRSLKPAVGSRAASAWRTAGIERPNRWVERRLLGGKRAFRYSKHQRPIQFGERVFEWQAKSRKLPKV